MAGRGESGNYTAPGKTHSTTTRKRYPVSAGELVRMSSPTKSGPVNYWYNGESFAAANLRIGSARSSEIMDSACRTDAPLVAIYSICSRSLEAYILGMRDCRTGTIGGKSESRSCVDKRIDTLGKAPGT